MLVQKRTHINYSNDNTEKLEHRHIRVEIIELKFTNYNYHK